MCFVVFFLVCWTVFFFKQKTAYEMRISDWSSDVCSSAMKSKHLFGARILLACKLGVDALGDVVDLVPRRIVDQPMDLMLDIARRTIIGIGSLEQRLAAMPRMPPGPIPAAHPCIRTAARTSSRASPLVVI